MKVSFDECFQTFPPIKAPADLGSYWEKALLQLKKTSVDPQARLLISKSLGRESRSEVSFASLGGVRLNGVLSTPRTRGKVPAVISFPDYHAPNPDLERSARSEGLAYLTVQLRGHSEDAASPAAQSPTSGTDHQSGPRPPASHLRQHGLDPLEDSYLYACYLDAVRCVDFLRLQKGIDASRIGLIGRGFGAAQAVFVAAMLPASIRALVLDRAGFLWFQAWLEDAECDLARELNSLLGNIAPRKKNRLKKNLALLEPLNWAEDLAQPVLAAIGLEDETNPPRAAFGFFNHVRSDKAMEIYPTEDTDPGGQEQFKKSLQFLAENLMKK